MQHLIKVNIIQKRTLLITNLSVKLKSIYAKNMNISFNWSLNAKLLIHLFVSVTMGAVQCYYKFQLLYVAIPYLL